MHSSLGLARQGFRKSLEWAESQNHEITDLSGMQWEHALGADAKLHDFLLMMLGKDALKFEWLKVAGKSGSQLTVSGCDGKLRAEAASSRSL